MKMRWPLLLLLILTAGCAPYYCQTPFGLAKPPVNDKGQTYWESFCVPKGDPGYKGK